MKPNKFDPELLQLLERLPCPVDAEQAYDGNMRPHKIHLVLGGDLNLGKLKREKKDALCKPFKRFWRLQTILVTDIGVEEICSDCMRQLNRIVSTKPNPRQSKAIKHRRGKQVPKQAPKPKAPKPKAPKPKTPKPKAPKPKARGLTARELEKKYPYLQRMKQTVKTSEEWYRSGVRLFIPRFENLGIVAPEFDISSGFTAAGIRPTKVAGQVFYAQPDRGMMRAHIFLSPREIEPVTLLGTVIHEVIHAIAGPLAGHKGEFKRIALGVGLIGPMRSTTWEPEEGEAFAVEVVKKLGAFPNEKFMGKYKKQGTRLLKVHHNIGTCGYTMRIASNWLKRAIPTCPIHGVRMTAEGLDDDD